MFNVDDKNTSRKKVQLSTTCFLRFGDEFLFIFRNKNPKKVDYMRLNGVGGKVEPGESFLQCAIREVEEETGYKVEAKDCRFLAVGHLSGGYEDDWLVNFFEMKVESKKIPLGSENREGSLIWMKADELLTNEREKVDDLNHIWPRILGEVEGESGVKSGVEFFAAQLDGNEKVEKLEWLRSK